MLDAIAYLSVITCALELNFTHSAIKTVATKESQISHLGNRADLTASQNPPLPLPEVLLKLHLSPEKGNHLNYGYLKVGK